MQMQQIMMAVCVQQRTPLVPQDAPADALLRRCFERSPTQRPTAADLAQAFASDVSEGGEGLARHLADQEAKTEEVTRVNSRMTQENARLQRQVEDMRHQASLSDSLDKASADNAAMAELFAEALKEREKEAKGAAEKMASLQEDVQHLEDQEAITEEVTRALELVHSPSEAEA
jgi:chromosome segregation ATPase